jgi:hypothetical protein
VAEEGDGRENKIYLAIAIFIILVVILSLIWSSLQLTPAYVPDDFLDYGWSENLFERSTKSYFFGLEKWRTLTYELNGKYPAYLTVTTFKMLVMMNEDDLRYKSIETIEKASQHGIIVNKSTEIVGERILINDHRTMYTLYDGVDTSKNPSENVKIICEVWNCARSGISVICIGVAQITDNQHNNSEINTTSWAKIVRDDIGIIDGLRGKDGLLFNVKCH